MIKGKSFNCRVDELTPVPRDSDFNDFSMRLDIAGYQRPDSETVTAVRAGSDLLRSDINERI